MELILKSNDESSIAKIITLANKLNVKVERKVAYTKATEDIEVLKNSILNFRGDSSSSIKDPVAWQREQRENRDLPFSR